MDGWLLLVCLGLAFGFPLRLLFRVYRVLDKARLPQVSSSGPIISKKPKLQENSRKKSANSASSSITYERSLESRRPPHELLASQPKKDETRRLPREVLTSQSEKNETRRPSHEVLTSQSEKNETRRPSHEVLTSQSEKEKKVFWNDEHPSKNWKHAIVMNELLATPRGLLTTLPFSKMPPKQASDGE